MRALILRETGVRAGPGTACMQGGHPVMVGIGETASFDGEHSSDSKMPPSAGGTSVCSSRESKAANWTSHHLTTQILKRENKV